MDGHENILEAIYEADEFENDDVEMADVEEGEFIDANINIEKSSFTDVQAPSTDQRSKNRKRRTKKKKNKRKSSEPGSNGTDINRFVLDACRRLKEKKSYMVYTAVGCLGVSALSELIKEVNAVQACGGQMTADGRRFRTGGGILWSIIKTREPNAYKEIMKRAKEFEKQFKQPNIRREATETEKESSQKVPHLFSEGGSSRNLPDHVQSFTSELNRSKESNSEEKRSSIHDRLRVPISYDDDLLQENPKEEDTTRL
ncbi:uncharacterized protein E5676_scaffold266G00350 [Cucumis melo var. makuwa]|uniref:Phosphorylated adapter RNA export protein n=1 Tax=Cucumis melo var. makuwa TaxID=1194695 RepID=A0A5D3DLH5_CUCMM|nr:uncharacterized protein E6C27_scaffold122G002920 [Cucumis melo var. makuwa]TYK24493.1 uncharacterized protein E5676_scaffold266G00350 [Cucumis melo var. makuwa]